MSHRQLLETPLNFSLGNSHSSVQNLLSRININVLDLRMPVCLYKVYEVSLIILTGGKWFLEYCNHLKFQECHLCMECALIVIVKLFYNSDSYKLWRESEARCLLFEPVCQNFVKTLAVCQPEPM